MNVNDAQEIINNQPQLLPALFRLNADLAVSAQQNSWPVWKIKERIRDLEILRLILKSVHKGNGERYFQKV